MSSAEPPTLYLAAAPVLSGGAADEPLGVGVLSTLELKTMLLLLLLLLLPLLLVALAVLLGVARLDFALLVDVTIELDLGTLSAVADAVGVVLAFVLNKVFPATTVTVRNLTSSPVNDAVTALPPVSSFPPFWLTVHIISTFFLL